MRAGSNWEGVRGGIRGKRLELRRSFLRGWVRNPNPPCLDLV